MAALTVSRTRFALMAVFLLHNCFQHHITSEALVLKEEFSGEVVTDMKVNLSADELWGVFRRRDYYMLLRSVAPSSYKSAIYVSGDGEVGTMVNITNHPESGGGYMYGRITKLDDKTRIREFVHTQGIYPNAGYISYVSAIKIIKEKKTSSIVRMTVSFDLEQASLSNISLVPTSWGPAVAIANYVNSVRSKPVVLGEEFSGEIVTDMKVNLPADRLWEVYRSKDFGHLMVRLLPSYFMQVIYGDGDGGVGTTFNATLQPAFGSLNWVERIIKIDGIKRIRIVRRIRGAFMDAGFTAMDAGYRIIGIPKKSSVVRSFTPFEIKVDSLSNASLSPPDWSAAIAVADYVNSLRLDVA